MPRMRNETPADQDDITRRKTSRPRNLGTAQRGELGLKRSRVPLPEFGLHSCRNPRAGFGQALAGAVPGIPGAALVQMAAVLIGHFQACLTVVSGVAAGGPGSREYRQPGR